MTKYAVTPEMIDVEIRDVSYTVMPGTTITICAITLENGYTVIGQASCIDPTLYDKAIGERIAYTNAYDKIYAVKGYVVKQRWYEETQLTARQRVEIELSALQDKIVKANSFLDSLTPEAKSSESMQLLAEQVSHMESYADVLAQRLDIWDK